MVALFILREFVFVSVGDNRGIDVLGVVGSETFDAVAVGFASIGKKWTVLWVSGPYLEE